MDAVSVAMVTAKVKTTTTPRSPCLSRNQPKFSRGVMCRMSRDSHQVADLAQQSDNSAFEEQSSGKQGGNDFFNRSLRNSKLPLKSWSR